MYIITVMKNNVPRLIMCRVISIVLLYVLLILIMVVQNYGQIINVNKVFFFSSSYFFG